MHFKDFITQQRVGIFFVGMGTFIVSLTVSHFVGSETLPGALFIDLAASAVTVVFTALIIDYLGLKEQNNKTQSAASLGEDEIKASCGRLMWRMARVFGMERQGPDRNSISTRQQARDYLNAVTTEVDNYLMHHTIISDKTPINEEAFPSYLERLQTAQNELEQTLLLYEYALSYSLRERILALRSELQIADRILGFIDMSDPLNDANISLIRVTAQSVYDAVQAFNSLQNGKPGTIFGLPLSVKH
jgi:hypothetical protein